MPVDHENSLGVARVLESSPGGGHDERSDGVQQEYYRIREAEAENPGQLRASMHVSSPASLCSPLTGLLGSQRREMSLLGISPAAPTDVLSALLSLPAHTLSYETLAMLGHSVNVPIPAQHATVVDADGDPYSEYILVFLHVLLIYFRPVPTAPIPLVEGDGAGNNETDQKAFGALTITSLAPKVLILIPHAHAYILRGLWFALIYLGLAFKGSKRGVAVEFLLERLVHEFADRESRSENTPAREREWSRRVGRVMGIRKEPGGLRLGDLWAEMKGMVAGGEVGLSPSALAGLEREQMDVEMRGWRSQPLGEQREEEVDSTEEEERGGKRQLCLSPDEEDEGEKRVRLEEQAVFNTGSIEG
ncbi:hypothetical protein P7C73_g1663, partial [Tremellales sp. Uapishka_1]